MEKTVISRNVAGIILDKYSRERMEVNFSNKDEPTIIHHKSPLYAIEQEAKVSLAMFEIVESEFINTYIQLYFEDGLQCTVDIQ